MLYTKIGIGILAGTPMLGTGGAAAAHQFDVPGTGADRQALRDIPAALRPESRHHHPATNGYP